MLPRRFSPASPTPPRRLAPSLALLLACALLWGQWLGQAHRVLHLPGTTHAARAHQVEAHEAGAARDVLAHLLAPADDAPDCRLYDQFGQGWAAALLLPVLPAVFLSQGQAWVAQARAPSSACAPFAARAPPLR